MSTSEAKALPYPKPVPHHEIFGKDHRLPNRRTGPSRTIVSHAPFDCTISFTSRDLRNEDVIAYLEREYLSEMDLERRVNGVDSVRFAHGTSPVVLYEGDRRIATLYPTPDGFEVEPTGRRSCHTDGRASKTASEDPTPRRPSQVTATPGTEKRSRPTKSRQAMKKVRPAEECSSSPIYLTILHIHQFTPPKFRKNGRRIGYRSS